MSTSTRDRTPEAEPQTAIWESITTVGPALVHWKVLSRNWEGPMHCVEVVFDAPDVVESSYQIERVYADETVKAQGARGDLSMSLPSRWWHEWARRWPMPIPSGQD